MFERRNKIDIPFTDKGQNNYGSRKTTKNIPWKKLYIKKISLKDHNGRPKKFKL